MKDIPNWRQYEWLLTKIYHDQYNDLEIKILHNYSILGKYSEIDRQVDILLKNVGVGYLTLVECKNKSRPIDVKGIEDFLGLVDDTAVNNAIIISSSGFSTSAKNRVKHLKNIKLEEIAWMDAYNSVISASHSYGSITDICGSCNDDHQVGMNVPGLLLWDIRHYEQLGKVYMIGLGLCLKCKIYNVYCDVCGIVTLLNKEDHCCEFMKYVSNQI